jgi:hypothetical protein
MIHFDPVTHTYTVDNQVIPSVTQIIGEWLKVGGCYVNVFDGVSIPADVFEAGRDAGTDVHKMVENYLDGDLDREALAPTLDCVLNQFVRWMIDYEPRIISYEKPLYSRKYHYCGTYDLEIELGRKKAIVDIKSGMIGMAGPQLAAYVVLKKEELQTRTQYDRYTLALPRDGSGYKFVKHEDPADWDFFLCRLSQYNYLHRR